MSDVSRQREALQRGLRRANFAWFIIVGVIGVLAVGVVWKAAQSAREAERANQNAIRAKQEAERANAEASRANEATVRAEKELWNARFTEARAVRRAGGPDARVKSSRTVAELARMPGLSEEQRLALRNEAVAQLALADIELPPGLSTNGISGNATWDSSFERYAIGDGRDDVKVYDADSGKVTHSFPVPTNFIRELVVFSPDGRYLAGVFKRNSSRVMAWRIADGSLVVSNATISAVGYHRPFFSPDSRVLAVYGPRELMFFDLESGAVTGRLPPYDNAKFSPDSRRLAVIEQNGVRILSFPELKDTARVGTDFQPQVISWNPDGTRMAIGGAKGELALCDSARLDEPPVRLGGHSGKVVFLTHSADGSLLLSWAWDTFTSVWDAQSGRRLLTDHRVTLIQLRRDSNEMIVEAGPTFKRGKARLLAPTGFKTLARSERLKSPAGGASFSEDGRFAATDYIQFSRLWDAATGRELAKVAGRSPVFVGSNSILTCLPDGVFRHELDALAGLIPDERGVLVGTRIFHHQHQRGKVEELNTISLTPDGRGLVIAARAAGVALMDLDDKKSEKSVRWLSSIPAHYANISSDQEWLLTRHHNQGSYLIALSEPVRPSLLGVNINTTFSPDGRLVAMALNGRMAVAQRNETNGWTRLARSGISEGVGSNSQLAFSPDGRWVAINTNRFEIHLFEARTLRPLATFTPPSGSPLGGPSLAFCRNGELLRVLLQDGDVVEWDIPVVRRELSKLGLDWEEPTLTDESKESSLANAAGHSAPTNNSASAALSKTPRPGASAVSSGLIVSTGVAALLAIAAGVVVFFHQRRTLKAYADAESLASLQQGKLAQVQDALFQSRKMEALGTLAAGVAHDFNNLLSIIRMSNQLVKRAVKPGGVTKENVEAIEQAVQQGKAIVNSMLGYSRRPAEVVEEFAVAKVLGDTVGLLSRQFLSGLILNVQIAPETPAIVGSPTRLEQVMLNLIVNASEAMKGSGTLTIAARPVAHASAAVLQPKFAGDCVELVVADNGPGVPAAVLPRIFEPFFTTKNAGAQRGTGLGLSMVYSIARDDGWGLDVTSVEGKGSTFRILLPAPGGEPGGRRLPTSQESSVNDSIPSGSL